jgi:hypothetical protein
MEACPDNVKDSYRTLEKEEGGIVTLPEKFLGDVCKVTWNSWFVEFEAKTFVFRMSKLNNIYSLEVVLLGTKKEANMYYAEISILDSKSKVRSLRSYFEPRPISQDKWGTDCFTVQENALAKLWSYNAENKEFQFRVRVKITMNED